nr:hypothetical protein [Tanacetum cinerariifolium]
MVPSILAEQFVVKHSLINMMTSDQFFELENDNPQDHIRWFNKITSTIKDKDVKNSAIKLMLFPISLVGDRYKDLIYTCPHHGFTELHQLNAFYNALNLADQDSLNSAMGGNLLERRTQDVLTIIKNKSKVCNSRNKSVVSQVKSSNAISNSSSEIAKLTHAVNQQTSAVTTTMTAILKKFQATPPPASVKAVEEILVTCAGAHPYYQCLATGGNTFPKLRDNIQGYVAAVAVNYNQGNSVYRSPGIARDVFVLVSKFTFPADFVIVDYEKMILCDGDERLPLNIRHDTSSYSNQSQKESVNLINVFNDSNEDFLENLFETNYQNGNPIFSPHLNLTSPKVKDDSFDPEGGNILPEKLLDLDSTKDLQPPHHVNPLSGSTTSFSSPNQLLKEFADELALITFPTGNDDLLSDIESDLKEIEHLLHHDPIKDINSILKDSIDQSNLADRNDNLVDSMPEMFTKEHALDYSSPPLYDEYNYDLFLVESETKNVYDDPFDSKGKKIKESKLLIDELDIPSDSLPSSEYDLFLFEDFSEVDALPLTNNEDKKPGHLAERLGYAETKFVTWDDLAFKLITLGWNVKHNFFCKLVIKGNGYCKKGQNSRKTGQNQAQNGKRGKAKKSTPTKSKKPRTSSEEK